jgi:RNA polymerase sigma factor (sigma-70 family)
VSDTADLCLTPEVQGMIRAAARRGGIFEGIGILDTDDVLSELTCVAVQAAKDFNPTNGARFTTYLWPRLVGQTVDLRRRYGRRNRSGFPRLTQAPLEAAAFVEAPAPVSDSATDLDDAISRLPARERAAFLLREGGGHSGEAIAALIGGDKTAAVLDWRAAIRRLRVGLPAG